METVKILKAVFADDGIKGVWEMLFNLFVQDPDFEWLMIDASYVKVHPHAAGAVGGLFSDGATSE